MITLGALGDLMQLVAGCVALIATAVAWQQLGGATAALPHLAPPRAAPLPPPHVVAVIPARDEAATIARCLAALQSQSPPLAAIWVIDDRSTDATAQIVTEVAMHDHRVHLIRGKERPAGWAGKNWALHQGVMQAMTITPDWLLLTDADTWMTGDMVARAVAYATARPLDLLSGVPAYDEIDPGAQLMRAGVGEFYSFMLGANYPRRANDPNDPAAMALGQFLLIRAMTMQAVGGYAADDLRAALADDRALALQVKRLTGRAGVVDATAFVRTVGYPNLAEAWRGHAHHLVPTVRARGMPRRAFLACIIQAFGILGPIVALVVTVFYGLWHGWDEARVPMIAYSPVVIAGFWVRWRAARIARLPRWYSLAGPLGTLLTLGLVLRALLRPSAPVRWKGQQYGK